MAKRLNMSVSDGVGGEGVLQKTWTWWWRDAN